MLAPMVAVVHNECDVLPYSFDNQDINECSLQSIDLSGANRSFFTQVQLSFPGPCGQLL